MFWVLPLIARRMSRTSENRSDTRIHVVTNSDDIVQHAGSRGYFPHHVKDYKQLDDHWFFKVKASLVGTVSPFEYEITILRWILFSEILKKWNESHGDSDKMTRLLILDGDVMMMTNAALFFHSALFALTDIDPNETRRDQDDLGFELISFGEGVCNLFSPHGLFAYANFIRQWFSKDVDLVVKESKDLGGIYFSDMELQRLFTFRNLTSRVNYLHALGEHPSLTHRLNCMPSSTLENLHKMSNTHFVAGNEILKGDWADRLSSCSTSSNMNLGIRLGGDIYSQCFIHFQGIKNKPWLYLYGRAFENLINLVTEQKLLPLEMEASQPNLIFQPSGSRSLFFVNATIGRKQHVASMDVFHKYNFSAQDVIVHVPGWISDMFPTMNASLV